MTIKSISARIITAESNYTEAEWKAKVNSAGMKELLAEQEHLNEIDIDFVRARRYRPAATGTEKLVEARLDIINKRIAQLTDVTSVL